MVAVPLSILVAFIGIYFTGNTINSMTLGGLALSIGILVDQAIVVVENISRHLAMGKSKMEATLDGLREVMLPEAVENVGASSMSWPWIVRDTAALLVSSV